MFYGAGYRVDDVRLSHAGRCAGLHDKAITLEADEMRAHRIVSQAQLGRQLLNRAIALAEQMQYLAASAFN